MKTLILILLLGCSANAEQFHWIKGRCYPTFPMHYEVNQKIDKNHYGAVTDLCSGMPALNCHAIIELSHYNPNLIGPVNTLVEYITTRNIKLDNGFDAAADVLKECVSFHACGNYNQERCVGKDTSVISKAKERTEAAHKVETLTSEETCMTNPDGSIKECKTINKK